MLLREATSETYGPRVYSHHINPHHCNLAFIFYFAFTFYFASLYQKYLKILYLADLTLVSGHVGIDNPYSRWLRGFICFCRYEGLARGLLLD